MQNFSCKGCIPPERHPGCHGTCPKYLEEKAKYEEQMKKYKERENVTRAILDQRGRAVGKAMRHRRKGKFYEQ